MSMRGASVPPFPAGYRASGVLLHVTSLPSPYGIGDLGPAAFAWVDRLHEAGQRWWQALPLGPTGYGDSPYQSLSSFAGNELLISPDALIDDGLLMAADCAGQAFSPTAVEYETVVPFKVRMLETAWSRFSAGARPDLRPAYDAAQAQHGRPGHGRLASRVRAGGRDGDAALPAPGRAGGAARHRVPLGRPERPAGHRPSGRDQSAARAHRPGDRRT
jgi:hypothetical protein